MSNGKQLEDKMKIYCEKKEEEKILKKDIGNLSSEIKEYLKKQDGNNAVVGKWRVELQHKVVEDLDEAKLVNAIQKYWEENNIDGDCPYIQYVPIINMEELERRIYNEEVPENILNMINSCRIKKETVALVYKKNKEGD